MKLLVVLSLIFSSQAVLASNLVEVLTEEGKFSTLVELVTKADLAETVATGEALTIFAPTDEAFEKIKDLLPAEDDKETLAKILTYHVLPSIVKSDDIENDMAVATVNGADVRANVYLKSRFYPGFITINGVRVSKADIEADNGVIHVITDVLLPVEKNIVEMLTEDGSFTKLTAALKAADLVETLEGEGPFTVFAPNDDAFAKIPEDALNSLLEDKEALAKILLRHVIPGSTKYQKGISWDLHETAGGEEIATQVFKNGIIKVVSNPDEGDIVNGARVVQPDMSATNGVVHVIDTVI